MRVKSGLAEMLKGGVIMDVTTAEEARIAEEAGAVAVMALERVPADIRKEGGVARMADPAKIKEIQDAVTIPVMAKARIGHFVEAQILEALEVDYIDESEVLTPADEANHINKWKFNVPFVCGATNLGEALRRISEGAAMIRTKGEAGTGDVVEAVRHMRTIMGEVRRLQNLDEDEIRKLFTSARHILAEWTERLRQQAGDFPEDVTAFRPEMAVHGKYNEPCPVCGTKVQRIVHAENETNYCPRCQTEGKLLSDRALSVLLKEDWPKTIEELEERP